MPRPKSPCGTYPAYQRHLREKTPVDPACRRAQQEHDSGRGRTLRRADREAPVVSLPAPTPTVAEELERRREDVQARFVKKSRALTDAATGDVDTVNLYEVIDLVGELDDLLDVWTDVADEIEYERGYPDLPEELRAKLVAAREASPNAD